MDNNERCVTPLTESNYRTNCASYPREVIKDAWKQSNYNNDTNNPIYHGNYHNYITPIQESHKQATLVRNYNKPKIDLKPILWTVPLNYFDGNKRPTADHARIVFNVITNLTPHTRGNT